MRKISKYLLVLLVLLFHKAHGQTARDTVASIKAFNQVMSFAVQPYLHYRSILSEHSEPVMRPEDTGAYHTDFYKVGDDLYYGNEQQEVYLQDSLMITLDHRRHAIQISRVDPATKTNVDLLPLRVSRIQKMLREHYLIGHDTLGGDTAEFVIRSKERNDTPDVATQLKVLYNGNNLRPYRLDVTLLFREPASQQAMEELRRRGIDPGKLVHIREGAPWLVLSQTMSIRFVEMNQDRQEAERMPSWTEKVAYDAGEQTFRGKGSYVDYEVTKTF
jgi:hypothetical protein